MSELTGPIALTCARERTQDRRATRLETAWLLHDRPVSRRTGQALLHDPDGAVPPAPGSPALIVLCDEVKAAATSALTAIGAGIRTYVLAPADGTGDASLARLADASATRLLVRRVDGAPAAAALCGGTGWLWIGSDGPGGWRLALDQRQTEAARRVFLELWWEHADDEAWPSESGFIWRARGDAPFDLPPMPADSRVRLEPTVDEPLTCAGGQVYAPDGRLPDGRPEQIWVPATRDGHERLANEVREGSRVAWTDFGLPACATGDDAVVVPSTARWSLRVSLTTLQADDLEQLLDVAPQATFGVEVALADIESQLSESGRVWRAGGAEPEPLLEREDIDAGTTEATSLHKLASAAPAIWPAPSPLALAARWTWSVRPPRAPFAATEDPLVKDWRALDKRCATRVTENRKLIEALERRETALMDSAENRGAALGFRRKREELQAGLTDVEAPAPSARGPEAALEALRKLSDIGQQLSRLDQDVAHREHALLERTERARQERTHAAAQERARLLHPELEEGWLAAQERLDDAAAALGGLSGRRAEMSKKDYRTAQRKAKDEHDRAAADVQHLERQVEHNQKVIATPFEYRPPAARKKITGPGSFTPSSSTPREQQVPHEALPAAGVLLRFGDERLLAIARWEDLEQGEQHAARLRARLVATAEEP